MYFANPANSETNMVKPQFNMAWYNAVLHRVSQIASFMGPSWGPPRSCRPQMGPMLAPWTLLSGREMVQYACIRLLNSQKTPHTAPVRVTKPIFFVPLFPVFQNYKNTHCLYDIKFIFDRCHSCWAAKTPDKYERDLKYSTYISAKSKFPIMEKLASGHLVTPTLDQPSICCEYLWNKKTMLWQDSTV